MPNTYYEVCFRHPDYSPLDCMPIGIDRRYLKAGSPEGALQMFKIEFKEFASCEILKVDDTECSSLDEVAEWMPCFNPKIHKKIN